MNKSIISKILGLLGIVILFSNCVREISDDAILATFSKNGDVYIDGFSSGLEYLPFGDSYFAAFTVDDQTFYDGESAMRFDIPNFGNPDGAYAGAIFPDYGRRDLSGFDALTFWAKGSRPGLVNEIGFGQDFGENKFQVSLDGGLQLTTNWQQYTIAIPNPEKLTGEAGLFWYAEGPEDGEGYTFWIDELQFVNLGNIGQARPKILDGQDQTVESFTGIDFEIAGCSQTFNLGNGSDQTINCTAAYFDFTSSDENVVIVDDKGVASAVGTGTAVITATINGVAAEGSLTINVIGAFSFAPTPTQDPADVISIFSDAYTNIAVDFYNGFWQPFQTTLGGATNIGGDNLLSYTELNFVGVQFGNNVPTVDASAMTHLRMDIFPREDIDPGDFFTVEVVDAGPDNTLGTGDDSSGETTISSADLANGEWYSLDIPLGSLGLINKANLAQVIFVTDGTVKSVFIDNIFLYSDGNIMEGPGFPFDFEDGFNPMIGFDNGASAAVVNNSVGGTNTSTQILQFNKIVGSAWYSGFVFDDGLRTSPLINLADGTVFTVKIWSPNAGIEVRCNLENGTGPDTELFQTLNAANEWVTLTFDYTGLVNATDSYTKIAFFPDFDASVQDPVAVEAIYYFDDITQQ